MAKIPSKVASRITAGIKRFQPILAAAKARDVGESDTVTIVVDMLAEILGYDKYSEITSEYAIRGTYCDLATKLDGILQLLIEVKAIGLDLKEPHVKQAVDYAANQGRDFVVLTNAISWRVYKVTFSKPIDQELVLDIDFCALNPKNAKDIESVYLLCKEGWFKSALGEYVSQKDALSRFLLGAMILSDPLLQLLRRELRRLTPDLRVEIDELGSILRSEVLKREVTEGDKASDARKRVAKAAAKPLRARKSKTQAEADEDAESSASEAKAEVPDNTTP